MPDTSKFTDHKISETLCTSVPDHQVVLSFNCDVGAFCFDHWWRNIGHEGYEAYCKANQNRLESLFG